jgi:hypothetical protein
METPMSADDLNTEFLALPYGRNGLPDLLILAKTYVPTHRQGIVHAYLVTSEKGSVGFWSEAYKAHGEDAVKWTRLHALERARQHVWSLQSADPTREPKPIEFQPFDSWDSLTVQRELGLYPMLQIVANASTPVFTALQEQATAYSVTITPQHYNPT